MAALWTEHNRRAMALEMAERFVAAYFGGARRLDKIDGEWLNHPSRFVGWFSLVDGLHRYDLACDSTGTWTVSRPGA